MTHRPHQSRPPSPLPKLALVAGLLLSCVSCFGPAAVHVPRIDPTTAGKQAMEKYDSDGNGYLTKAELSASPGLLAGLRSFDRNQDNQISPEEIAERVEVYRERGAGLKMVVCKVFLDGRPLVGAQVELVPEEFLGSEVHAASGTSRTGGVVPLRVPDEALPKDMAGVQGVQLGVYRVSVNHPSIQLPERYTSGSELGVEIGPSSHAAVFQLKRK